MCFCSKLLNANEPEEKEQSGFLSHLYILGSFYGPLLPLDRSLGFLAFLKLILGNI